MTTVNNGIDISKLFSVHITRIVDVCLRKFRLPQAAVVQNFLTGVTRAKACGDKGFLSPPGVWVGPGMADYLGVLFKSYHLPRVPQKA